MPYFSKTMPSPVGVLTLIATDKGIAAILWNGEAPGRIVPTPPIPDSDHAVLLETERQLQEYFAGARQEFTVARDVRGTSFQKQVWDALCNIPFGETRTYAEIARQIGRPKAVRAVGAANGKNPVAIVAPCHRVIGANGTLTGFAGGLQAKARLLAHEGVILGV